MSQKGRGNKSNFNVNGDYTEGDRASGDINKNKSFRFSLSFFAIAALAMGGVSTVAIRMNWFQLIIQNLGGQLETPNVAPSSTMASSEPVAPQILATPANPEIAYSGASKVEFLCGKPTDFSGVEVLADCPTVDADKDGRPDQDYVLVYFTNKTDKPQSVSFADFPQPITGNSGMKNLIENLNLSRIKAPIYEFSRIDRNFIQESFKGTSTVTLKAGQSIAFLEMANSFVPGFSYEIGAGKPSLNIKESTVVKFTPEFVTSDIYASPKFTYGAFAKMHCDGSICMISLENNAAEARGFSVQIVQNGIDWTFIAPAAYGNMGNIFLLPRRAPYEVTFIIPE